MPTIITRVVSGKSATRTDYISRNNLHAALEGQGRGLYGATVNDLKRVRGTSYLRGPNHINEVQDLMISPANPDIFTSLGASAEEREANLKSAVRAGMAELESRLGLELRWLATQHRNSSHQHLHILISEEATKPDGTTQRLRRLPRQVFAPEANGNTALGNIFLRRFEERGQRPFNAVSTRENPELASAPAAQAAPSQPEATPLQPESVASVLQASLATPDAQLDGVWRAMQEGDGTVGVYYGHEVHRQDHHLRDGPDGEETARPTAQAAAGRQKGQHPPNHRGVATALPGQPRL